MACSNDDHTEGTAPAAGACGSDSLAELTRLAARLSGEDAGRDLAGLGVSVLGEQLVALRGVIDRLEASFTARLAPFDASGGARSSGAASTTGWLKSACGMLGSAASERVRIARHLPDLPTSATAFTTGDVSYGHAAVLSKVARDVGPDTARRADPALTEAATRLSPDRLKPVGDRLRHCVDPDGTERDAHAAYERRRLHLSETLDGLVVLDGLLDPESGAVVRTALGALAPPPGPSETRTAAQRRADALVELAGHAMDTGGLPEVGGTRPQLTVTATPETLQQLAGASCAETDTGTVLPGKAARRVGCDATVTRVLVDTDSQPLDVGRATAACTTTTAATSLQATLTLAVGPAILALEARLQEAGLPETVRLGPARLGPALPAAVRSKAVVAPAVAPGTEIPVAGSPTTQPPAAACPAAACPAAETPGAEAAEKTTPATHPQHDSTPRRSGETRYMPVNRCSDQCQPARRTAGMPSETDPSASEAARGHHPIRLRRIAGVLDDNDVQRALVVAAHPDDIDFGAAGTVAHWTDAGAEVSYLLVTDGDAGGFDPDLPRAEMSPLRRAEQTAAAKCVGVDDLWFLGYQDGRVEPTLDLRRDIARVIRQVRPQRLACPSPERDYERLGVSHPDHRAAGSAALDAVYPDARNPFAYPELLADEGLDAWTVPEVWIMGSPLANHHVDVTETFDRKVAALRAHVSQTEHMDDLEGMLRGWLSGAAQSAGMPEGRLAETFQVIQTG